MTESIHRAGNEMASRVTVGAVSRLYRYPVKSMLGECLQQARLTDRGIKGDRIFAVTDASTGKVANARNPRGWPHLLEHAARTREDAGETGGIEIVLPNGDVLDASDNHISEVLSRTIGRPVVLAGNGQEAMPPRIYYVSETEDETLPSGTFFDCEVMHVLTTATLRQLAALYPEGSFDYRRFRPNILVEAPEVTGFIEDGWIGKVLSIGSEVKLQVSERCERCVVTTLAQNGLPPDPRILKTAGQHNAAYVGVYARVVRTGSVVRGDRVFLE